MSSLTLLAPHPHPNVGVGERMISLLAGGLLVVQAARLGLGRRPVAGGLLAFTGLSLMHRGITGYCHLYHALGITDEDATLASHPLARGIHARHAITIGKSPDEVYRFWRDLANLPIVFPHLHSITHDGNGRSTWLASGPLGRDHRWEASLVDDVPGERLRWQSIDSAGESSDLALDGTVELRPAPPGRGTEVSVTVHYRPRLGALTAAIIKLRHMDPRTELHTGLRRARQWLEVGELTTSESPSGRDDVPVTLPAGHDMPGSAAEFQPSNLEPSPGPCGYTTEPYRATAPHQGDENQ